MNALIINQYAANKGDRAIAFFLVRELRRLGFSGITVSTHDQRFWTGCNDPFQGTVAFCPWGWDTRGHDTHSKLGWRWWWEKRRIHRRVFHPWMTRRLLRGKSIGFASLGVNRQFLAVIQQADVVISTGGHHITSGYDRDCIYPTVYDLMVAVLVGKPVIVWSQTIGPVEFTTPLFRDGMAALLNKTKAIYLRDSDSFQVLHHLGIDRRRVHSTGESVIGLNDVIAPYRPPSERQPVVGMAVYNAVGRPPHVYDQYCERLAAVADQIVEDGRTLLFFPHEMRGATVEDRPCIEAIRKRMRHADRTDVLEEDLDTVAHLKKVHECQLFIGHKTHSVIFALTVGTPLLAIAYHPKTHDFMARYGLAHHCVDESQMDTATVLSIYRRIVATLDETGRLQYTQSVDIAKRVRQDLAEAIYSLEST